MSTSLWVVVVFVVVSVLAMPPGVALLAASSSAGPAVFGGPLGAPGDSVRANQVRLSETYGKLPLYFEANRGQSDPQVKFLSRGAGHMVFLTSTEAVLIATRSERADRGKRYEPTTKWEAREKATRTTVRMAFVGANRTARVIGREELPAKANYFIGNDPGKWRTNVPTYAKVRYEAIYPGIDLVFYGKQRQLEYDFVIRPGADPKRIRLAFQGADKLEVDAHGDLVLHTAAGLIRQGKPVIYQEIDGVRREIKGGYVLDGARRIGFWVGAHDRRASLVIDPTLFYSTYLGGNGLDEGRAIAVDVAGNAYVTGFTQSPNFPTTAGAVQRSFGSHDDVFVTKLDPTGSSLVYSTYLGGSATDEGLSIAVDAAGNAYVTGITDSPDLPTTPGAFQVAYAGGFGDAFVTKLDPNGSALVYSTYLGGSTGSEYGAGISIDALGNAYVTGPTSSLNFPTTAGALRAVGSIFVTKLDPTGSTLVYSTYLCCNADTFAIAVDTSGSAYVTGHANSQDVPTTPGAFQGVGSAPSPNAFVTKLDPTGSAVVYSTYLGGSGDEVGQGIAVDAAGNAYVTGSTTSIDFPTANAVQPTFGGVRDAFVTKLNPAGSAVVYSTYLGGSDRDAAAAIAIDTAGNAYVTGHTESVDFPTTSGAFHITGGGFGQAFVTKLDPTGSNLVYSTRLGGSIRDEGTGIAVDTLPNPNAYVTGLTVSPDFPTSPGAFQTVSGGGQDAFVAKITDVTLPSGPFSARVTGGGTIDVTGGIGNFHLIVQQQTDGTLNGRLQYVNHASGARTQSEMITSMVITGNRATVTGTCTVNGAPCTFRVDVTDNGQPGTNDRFTISVDLAPSEGGPLRSGNILITQ